MKKFEVGKIYIWPALYTSSFAIKVVSRTENSIIFEELAHPGKRMCHIVSYDHKGNEVILAWKYQEENGYVRA